MPQILGRGRGRDANYLTTCRNVIALISGFPCADGEPYADFFETQDGVMPFPGLEPIRGTRLC
jgi:hypothetical protein